MKRLVGITSAIAISTLNLAVSLPVFGQNSYSGFGRSNPVNIEPPNTVKLKVPNTVNPKVLPVKIYPNTVLRLGSLPDLIIETARIRLASNCRVNRPALYVEATVKNIGRGRSPSRTNVGIVSAKDSRIRWSNGKGIPALNPGAKTTVTFPIYYLRSNPQSMLGQHTFNLTVNKRRLNGRRWIRESNTRNNNYRPISINVPNGHCNVQAPPKVKKISANLIARLIKSAANGTKLHLHNLGPKRGHIDSYHKEDASYIKLSNSLGGTTQRFTIPEHKINVHLGAWRYYINKVNLSDFDMERDGNRFKFSLFFESQDTELKGYHTGSVVDLGDNGAPDVQMDNMRLDVYLKPAKDSQGRLTYSPLGVNDVRFSANIYCRRIPFCSNYKTAISKAIKDAVRGRLNSSTTRNQFAAGLKPVLRRLGIGRIISVRIQGSDLVFVYR